MRAALSLEQPDRVPIAEFVVDEQVAKGAVLECTDAADAMDRFGIDTVSCGATFDVVKRADDGAYWDEWGVMYRPGPEAFAHPVRGLIRTYEDAEAYQPPDPAVPVCLAPRRDRVRRYKGVRAMCSHHRAAFMWSAYLMGLDGLLMAMVVDRGLAELALDKVLDTSMQIVRAAIRAGAEVIILGDDHAYNRGPLMSPALFEAVNLPRLLRMTA